MTTREFEEHEQDWEGLLLPVILMVTGALVLAGVNSNILSLDRMRNLWPAAVMLVGLVDMFPFGKGSKQ